MALLKWMFGGQKEADKFKATVQPQMDIASGLASYGIDQGKFNIDKATGDIDYLSNYFKDILHGTPDHILKDIDASSITGAMDDTFQNTAQNAVRGGMRAGNLGQLEFDKGAAINRIIQSVRQSAPDQIKSLAQMIAQIGTGQLQIGAEANDTVINVKSLIEQVKQNEKARKAGIFGSVMAAIGGVLGGGIASDAIHFGSKHTSNSGAGQNSGGA